MSPVRCDIPYGGVIFCLDPLILLGYRSFKRLPHHHLSSHFGPPVDSPYLIFSSILNYYTINPIYTLFLIGIFKILVGLLGIAIHGAQDLDPFHITAILIKTLIHHLVFHSLWAELTKESGLWTHPPGIVFGWLKWAGSQTPFSRSPTYP